MKKDFLDELMEELQKLKDQAKEITIPVPVAPHEVFRAIERVAKNHNLSANELESMMGLRDVTKADLDLIRDIKAAEANAND